MSIIAYQYNADNTYCVPCTTREYGREAIEARFEGRSGYQQADGYDTNGIPVTARDPEGNPIHPLFGYDEWWQEDDDGNEQVLQCHRCRYIIDVHEGELDESYDDHYNETECDCDNCEAAATYDPEQEADDMTLAEFAREIGAEREAERRIANYDDGIIAESDR